MNTNNLIHSFFNPKSVKTEKVTKYTPRVQSTVKPTEKLTYNEIHEQIQNQLNIYKNK